MRFLSIVLLLLIGLNASANKRPSEIYLELQKLRSLKRVLYIAAHPDDENTRALAWFSLGEKAETAYLSLTRGGGGQNLIGTELSEELGVLRTQELLAARSYDGARQFFSRAVDFGYSKSATESLGKWGDEEILSDVVLVIRQFRPDVIITRFPPDKRGGHGHHTASAMLAIEAFEKAADPDFLPEQVEQYGAWETTSIYWNTSYWWMKDIADTAKNNKDYLTLDIGGYCKELGMSYNEIGSIARSQHKCQGFGAIKERGSRIEYFQHLAGDKISDSFFENSQKSWTKLINQQFQTELDDLVDNFDFKEPSNNVEDLLTVLMGLESLEESRFKNEKISLCNQLIINCMGLYIEIVGSDYSFVSGDSLEVSLNVVNRSDLPIQIAKVGLNGSEVLDKPFEVLSGASEENTLRYLSKEPLGGPYWLRNEHTDLYVINDKLDLGKAKGTASLMGTITLIISGKELNIRLPAEYKWRDPSYGEKRREMVCTPAFTVRFDQDITILKAGEEKEITLTVHSYSETTAPEFKLQLPKGWHSSADIISVDIQHIHDEKTQKFKITVDENAEDGNIEIVTLKGESVYSSSEIAYDHIPTQMLLTPAKMKCVKLDAEIKKGSVAYINGVKDAVPAAISQLGFEVQEYEVKDLINLDLSQFQTIVLGIRIYNVQPELVNLHDKLFG